MKKVNGIIGFGLFRGMEPDDDFNEAFDDYFYYKNRLSKSVVAAHIRSLPVAVSGVPVKDIFTGKDDGVDAVFNDGPFTFPIQFLRYYETYDIGIPPEYEDYLINVVGLK